MADAIRQPSFAAGELAPSLWGRTDLDRYAKGLRLCRDFFIGKQGDAVSRPGTRFLGFAAANSVVVSPPDTSPPQTVIAGAVVRLIPFYFSDTDSTQNCVLEFGEQYFRIWRGGQVVSNDAYSGGVGITNYHQGDLYKIRYTQSLDVLVLACAGYPPCSIARQGANAFAFGVLDFSQPPSIALAPQLDESTLTSPDASHLAQPQSWKVSQIIRRTSGAVYETAPVALTGAFFAAGAAWNSVAIFQPGTWVKRLGSFYLCRNANSNLPPESNNGNDLSGQPWGLASVSMFGPTPEQQDAWAGDAAIVVQANAPVTIRFYAGIVGVGGLLAYRVYRGRGGVFGWVGDSTGSTFVDYGATPDLTQQPPMGINPFVVDLGGGVTRVETPISCAFFEDRLVFGGTVERPSTLFCSATGDYYNFDQPLIPVDNDSLIFTLSSRKRELMRSVVGKDKLFALTNSGLWAIGGAGTALAPASVDAHVHVDVGSDWPAPLVVGNSILWPRDQGAGLRGVEFDFSRGAYVGTDLSFQAEHLVVGHQIVDMCHAENPFGVTWLAREDGILLGVTHCPDDQFWGWARHGLCVQNDGTAQKVISLCSIPEDGRDAVYLALADPAGGAAWILRMSPRVELDDEALESIAGSGGGLEYNLGMGLGQGGPGSQTPTPSGFVAPGTPICLDAWSHVSNFTSDSGGIFHFSSLNMFANRAVWFIIDGHICGTNTNPPAPITVASNGTVAVAGPTTTTYTAGDIYVGLPYEPELELLDLAVARDKQKVCNEVVVEVLAHGKFKAGADFAHLDDHDIPPADDDLTKVQVQGNWSAGGRAVIRQHLPMPLTVRAVTRKVRAGAG